MTASKTTRDVRVSPDVLFRSFSEEESVLVDLASGTYFGLNEVGTFIWTSISEHGSIARTLDELTSEFDVERDRANGDIHALVEQLLEKGLLVAEPGS